MVLSTNFDDYEKGEFQRVVAGDLLGTGIFLSDGDRWRFHRSMARPFFSKERISDFDIFDRHADQVILKLKERFSQGIAVDIQDVFSRFALDAATEFLFGGGVGRLSAELPYPPSRKGYAGLAHPSDEYATAFRRIQERTLLRMFYGNVWPLFEFWKDGSSAQKTLANEFLDPFIEAALEKRDVDGVHELSKKEGNLLDHLVRYTDDRDFIRSEALGTLIASYDTTTAWMTFVIAMLAEHPEVYARLRREVLDTVGPSGKVGPDSLRDMKYLLAILNETLRLYPPIPLDLRCTSKGVVWPSKDGGKPIYIPPGTEIYYSLWLVHRREDLWGPNADEFNPDRFMNDRAKQYLSPDSFIFIPFNPGPRVCLGQQFAYNEVSAMIIRIVQTFGKIELDMDSNPGAKPPADWVNGKGRKAKEKIWVRSHITISASGGAWVKMEEADPE